MEKVTKIKIICAILYFLILYAIAFQSAGGFKRREKRNDEFLGILDTQWQALLLFWVPALIAMFKR